MPRIVALRLDSRDTTERSCPTCFALLHALADRLRDRDQTFDRSGFLALAYEIFGEPLEPVTGSDPRD
jgi:hypothetical protein